MGRMTDMATIKLRGVTRDRDRHGSLRYYYRAPGKPKARLRGLPGSDEFSAAYKAALAGRPVPGTRMAKRVPEGSFEAVVHAYYADRAVFKKLDPSTQAWRRRALDGVCREHGEKPIALMRPKHIYKLLEEKADTPGAANTLLKALRALFKWAVKRELAPHNPARDVEKIAYLAKGHHSWTLAEVAQYEARHPVGTKARLAMALLLYTTGRREDAVRLGRQHLKVGRLKFVQAKNEHRNPVEVDIPAHPDLLAAIEAVPSPQLAFLTTAYGQPFTPAGFGQKFRQWCDEAGLPHCSAHGLRKAMSARFAEHGATVHEIMAVTGHQTLEEVERYTRAAMKPGLADSAMAKVGGMKKGT